METFSKNPKPLSLDSFANVSLCRMSCGDSRVMEKHLLFYHKPTNSGAVFFMEASSCRFISTSHDFITNGKGSIQQKKQNKPCLLHEKILVI